MQFLSALYCCVEMHAMLFSYALQLTNLLRSESKRKSKRGHTLTWLVAAVHQLNCSFNKL